MFYETVLNLLYLLCEHSRSTLEVAAVKNSAELIDFWTQIFAETFLPVFPLALFSSNIQLTFRRKISY